MTRLGPVEINEARCLRLIRDAIVTFDLNLSSLVILTEGATGYYMLTPMIAALAGADRVYALTRDSRYGTAKEVHEKTMALAGRWGIEKRIEILFSREDDRIGLADIVTNLGFVRPIDRAFLGRLKQTAVIPLMFETWEFREEDLNLEECRRLGIPVAGTDEHHSMLQTFVYVGYLALKMLLELDIEIYRSRLVVVGGGEFGEMVSKTLASAGANVKQIDVSKQESLQSQQAKGAIRDSDAVVIVEHRDKQVLIGSHGQVAAKELLALNPGIVVAHIAGGAELQDIESVSLPHHPKQLAPPGYMSLTTDYLGPRPLIDLHTAGLRVGQALAQAVSEGYSGISAEKRASKLCPLVQGFDV